MFYSTFKINSEALVSASGLAIVNAKIKVRKILIFFLHLWAGGRGKRGGGFYVNSLARHYQEAQPEG